jgi:hypothetical protein
MKVKVFLLLERLFARLELWAGEMKRRISVCPDCGRNRYTGAPCKGI